MSSLRRYNVGVDANGSAPTNTVRVRLFAGLREAVGQPEILVVLPDGATVAELRDRIGEAYPVTQALLPIVVFAVDEEYVDADHRLRDGDEVAVIPPVSGGARV